MREVERPIAVFDSGLGGISVLRALVRLMPQENYLYFGDSLHAPYGTRPTQEIRDLSFAAAQALFAQGVKALVIACNTATSASINVLRKRLDVPVISVEPAIKPACEIPGDGKIFMLATAATTRLARYRALQERMPDPQRVLNFGISGIVARIESGIVADDAFDDIFDAYLAPYHGMKADGIVLGCTHYIFIARAVERYFKKHFCGECRLFDGNSATVRQLGRVLEQSNLGNFTGCGKVAFHTSGNSEKLKPVFDMLLDMPIYKQGEE